MPHAAEAVSVPEQACNREKKEQAMKTSSKMMVQWMAAVVGLLALFLCPSSGWAATVTSAGSGNWNSTTVNSVARFQGLEQLVQITKEKE